MRWRPHRTLRPPRRICEGDARRRPPGTRWILAARILPMPAFTARRSACRRIVGAERRRRRRE